MIAPDQILLAARTSGAIAIRPVAREGVKALAAALPSAARAWMALQGFDAAPGQHVALPSPDGGVAEVLYGAGGDPFLFGKLARALPAGAYRIEGALPALHLSVMGFLLEAYDFDRYKKMSRNDVKLVCPEGLDRAAILSAAAASWLARDLVNTPTSDMGPDELEAAARRVAKAFKLVIHDGMAPKDALAAAGA